MQTLFFFTQNKFMMILLITWSQFLSSGMFSRFPFVVNLRSVVSCAVVESHATKNVIYVIVLTQECRHR